MALRKRKPIKSFVEIILHALGSWTALVSMAVFSVAWVFYDQFRDKPPETLDLVISIWTMILDVLVIIGANYTRVKDKQTLERIYRAIKNLRKNK